MKILFASDLHGSASAAEKVLEWLEKEGADRFFLLGDLLYHGPRNNLPDAYDPKGVIALLNGVKNELLCVRGNCDCEVDQMVLRFPVLADYGVLFLGGRTVYRPSVQPLSASAAQAGRPADSRPHACAHRAGEGRHDLHQPRLCRPAEGRSSQELHDL